MDQKDIVLFQIRRTFNVLAKRTLMLMEDLQNDHDINFDKLRKELPEEYLGLIEMANYFDSPKFTHFRKRILDIINDGFREFSEELDKYELSLKRN